MKTTICFFAVLMLALSAAADDKPTLLNSGDRASLEAARAAWEPAEQGTPAMELRTAAGQAAELELTCNFTTNHAWRVAWDHPSGAATWDLSACQTLHLNLRADGEEPAGLILYLHSGDGWYGCHFSAIPGQGEVLLQRKKFTIEGKPGGWDRIDRLRLSVLNDEPRDRRILVGDLLAIAHAAQVAIYRNDAGLATEPGVGDYARRMADALDRLSISYEIVGDSEVAAGRLVGKKVAILPLNPVLPKASADAMAKFIAGGGKLIVCYCLPEPLEQWLGIQTTRTLDGGGKNQGRLRSFTFQAAADRQAITVMQDSWIAHGVKPVGDTRICASWEGNDGKPSAQPAVTGNANGFFIGHVLTPSDEVHKDLLIQEMIGRLWPGMWEDVYKARLDSYGQVAGFGNAVEVIDAIEANSGRNAPPRELLVNLPAKAAQAAAAGRFAQGAELQARAQADLLHALAASVPSKPGEFRAVWCHSPSGVAGLSWDQAAARLADAGFNAIIVNMCWGDSAAYDSKVLPRAAGINTDELAECLAAAKKHSLAVHVWRVDWNLWWNVDPTLRSELRKAGRLQEDAAGKPVDWLCPSNPQNQKLELDAMLEIARNYDVAGLHFDYIRYPDQNACFCAGCRKRFETLQGAAVKHWPADVTSGPLKEQYLQFRRDNITALVASVSSEARKIRPGIKISAAVFPHWASARNEVGQDWKLWAQKGYVDFLCPMQYTDEAPLFQAMTRQNLALLEGKASLMPGIGATLGNSPDGTLAQVLLARKAGAAGFVLFNYDPGLFEHLDLLKLGATSKATEAK